MRYLDWLLRRPKATVDPRGISKSASSDAQLVQAPSPLRDNTGSHWVQVFRRNPDPTEKGFYVGTYGVDDWPGPAIADWVWCCTICQTLSLASAKQSTADPAPHMATAEHQAKMAEWDTDERHACVYLPAPVWEQAGPLAT